jgi:hypothetical protein
MLLLTTLSNCRKQPAIFIAQLIHFRAMQALSLTWHHKRLELITLMFIQGLGIDHTRMIKMGNQFTCNTSLHNLTLPAHIVGHYRAPPSAASKRHFQYVAI